MSLNGEEWGLNDLIWCCLLLGDSTGLNHLDHIPHHSTVIPVWSLILSLDWDWNELEWRGMRLFLEEEKKTGFWDACHSNIIPSFQHHSILMRASHIDWDWNELEWRGMRSEWFNMVLSLLKRQQHIKKNWSESYIAWRGDEFFHWPWIGMTWEWGMTLKWQEWSSNEWNDHVKNTIMTCNDGMPVEWGDFQN